MEFNIMREKLSKIQKIIQTETDIRRQVKDYLQIKGWLVLYHLQGLGAQLGMPDLQIIKNGRVIMIELKRSGGRQSEKQKEFQQQWEAAGGTYVLCRGIEDLKDL